MKDLRACLPASALCVAALAVSASGAAGPTSPLFITNYGEFGANTGIDVIQGLTVYSFDTGLPIDIDIAVYGDVRTLGYGDTDVGKRFDFAGNPLVGGPYVNSVALSQFHDGTSDGSYNYSVDFPTRNVMEFDRNWASPVVLFNAAANVPDAGHITINATDGSFWISEWGGPDQVAHYSHTGTLLSSFNSGILGSAGIALDPVDGTLWMGDYTLTLHQFDQSGNPLQSVPYSGSLSGSWYGMEFDTTPVPEPASLALLGGGLLMLLGRARRNMSSGRRC